ncbi:hypothetical protein AVV44_gp261 [Cronobacter phage S13]|jgi:hypothetical protein|uniref:Uncharacterized protein n=1 Tax=Cronobacter phage LPCS28 TaxID=2924885 RepID=A0AAE9GCV2_9CAUD|nr:hypothetical protein AVV44_gp261 [Cronobacter phage S13]YP_010665760.1 hypothetical protein PQB73_gp264 [Cronobacter phage LPCS28]AIA64978.1 hypothetical protein S13_180 [Cronobacter phage S13]UNY46949.1 hypothetical protein EHEKIMEA_00054 [Cronobacter phage LPCS28]
MNLIPRISVTVDHHANAQHSPASFNVFQGTSRFAIRADKVVGLVEQMDGTVLIAYKNKNDVVLTTFVEEKYSQLFTEIKDFATL